MADDERPDDLEEKPREKPRVTPVKPVADTPPWEKPGWLPSTENLIIEATRRFANRFRFVRVLGQWLVYEGGVWGWDERDQMNAGLGAMCREIGSTQKRTVRLKLEAGSNIVRNIENRLRGELAATSEQWDADPLLVNTRWKPGSGKVVEMMPWRPEDYCTKQTATMPERVATPLWDNFLSFVTGGDTELQAYLQRAAGYSASGSTIEQCLFVLYGSGANGKSVFLNTVAGVLGSYACATPIETIIARQHERHPEELARLRGVRMVTTAESGSGQAFNEGRIKLLTGGDKIVARFMKENSFEYTPQFKLWMLTNNRPHLRNVDYAIMRRLHLVPFLQTVAETDRNLSLEQDLQAEWAGILQWVLDGLALWRDGGLQPPDTVVEATKRYVESEDVLAMWIEEEIDLIPTARTASSELFASWKKWAEARGERALSNKWLTAELEKRGHVKDRIRSGSAFIGFAIRAYRDNTGPDRFV